MSTYQVHSQHIQKSEVENEKEIPVTVPCTIKVPEQGTAYKGGQAMTKQIVIAAGCMLALAMVIITSSCASQPSEPPPPASSPAYPNHGITSTRTNPEPGDNIYRSSSLMIRLTMDDLIEKSDAVVIGKVVDIFPARRVDINGPSRDWIITTDVVIEVERYLYGQPSSRCRYGTGWSGRANIRVG